MSTKANQFMYTSLIQKVYMTFQNTVRLVKEEWGGGGKDSISENSRVLHL